MALYAELEPALARLRKAVLSPATHDEVTEAIIALAQAGRQLSAKQTRKMFTELMQEIAPATKSGDLEFTVDALQKVFDKEVKGKMTSFSNAFEWFLKSQSKLVTELRERMSGLDLDSLRFLLNITGSRMISADSIVRNSYLPKIAKSFFKSIQDPAHQTRLGALLKPFIDSGAIKRFQQTGLISDLDFWKIKGGIMELLAEQTKLAYLAERFPKAVKIEGVMATTRMTRDGAVSKSTVPLQIWDGIIAEITGSRLIIHAKFEIKSGLQGFTQGMTQILDTFYHRFVSKGDTLHLEHKGKKYVFVNNPNVPSSIQGADSLNVLITPKGLSDVLPNQALDYGDFPVEFLWLKIDDVEVDHRDIEALTLDFLETVKV